MDGRLQRLLADPARFFETASPSLSRSASVPAAIGVLCLGVFPPVQSLLRSPMIPDEEVLGAFPPIRYATAGWEVSLPGLFGIILATLIVGPAFFWLVYTAIFHVLSWPVASERGFGRTAALVAWGFVPLLFGNVVVLALLLVAFPATPTELWSVGVTLPARIYALPPDPGLAFVVANGFSILCTLWSGYLWAHAVAVARGVTFRQAIVVVAVPVVLSLGPI
ncbi:YIP1 family protein [Natribaculum luteum]|uniref:YIP1 family protein n=1 Tax=Natribaculum luteum TaxID=1586232 RepID=A0ABD5NVW6_9EURY|nr:YIP1 family protein [Natribaculum luteum]